MKYVYKVIDFMRRLINKLFVEPGMKNGFKQCGSHVKIGAGCEIKPLFNIVLGSFVEIGPRALLWTTKAQIVIGSHVIFGPGVTIITGDHSTDVIGKYIMDITDSEKNENDDQDVIIEDDVWIGCNVTILKGVHIHTGAIVAAGSVVTKDVDSYTICGGVPAKKIKNRFTDEEVQKHIKMLNQKRGV